MRHPAAPPPQIFLAAGGFGANALAMRIHRRLNFSRHRPARK
jgi:hypothetical protein